jgi:hypothetical protein
MTAPRHYHLPRVALSVVDTYNALALATGSTRAAMVGTHASYNGHAYRVWSTIYGDLCLGYTWAGSHTITRSADAATVLASALRTYDRATAAGTRGHSLGIDAGHMTAEQAPVFAACDRLIAGPLPKLSAEPWWTWRHEIAHACAHDAAQRRGVIIDFPLLADAATPVAYFAALATKYGGSARTLACLRSRVRGLE